VHPEWLGSPPDSNRPEPTASARPLPSPFSGGGPAGARRFGALGPWRLGPWWSGARGFWPVLRSGPLSPLYDRYAS
jgi:hypothetical protein